MGVASSERRREGDADDDVAGLKTGVHGVFASVVSARSGRRPTSLAENDLVRGFER